MYAAMIFLYLIFMEIPAKDRRRDSNINGNNVPSVDGVASSWFQSYAKSFDYFSPINVLAQDNDTNLPSDSSLHQNNNNYNNNNNADVDDDRMADQETLFGFENIFDQSNSHTPPPLPIIHDEEEQALLQGGSDSDGGDFKADVRPVSSLSRKSSTGQTVFNTINVFVGLGILALPYAYKLDGWIIGTFLMVFMATITRITAIMLVVSLKAKRTTIF